MKKILIALLCFISLSTTAQNSTEIPIPDSSKLTLIKVYNDTKAGITGLAAALKTPAIHVYQVLVKQQLVYSVTYSVVLLVFLILTLRFGSVFSKNYKRTQNQEDVWYREDIGEQPGLILPLILSIILSIITISIFSINISDIVSGFINPEYGAIKDIIHFVK